MDKRSLRSNDLRVKVEEPISNPIHLRLKTLGFCQDKVKHIKMT